MALQPYEKLSKNTNYRHYTTSDQVQSNLCSFFDWGFLTIGAYWNIPTGSTPIYGSRDPALLRLSDDRNYASGRVWEGYRNNWVWESGHEYSPTNLTPSGVFVNGTFHPNTSTGTFSHTVDYPGGRVIFNSAIPTGSTVKAAYSFKHVQFLTADQQTFQQILKETLRGDDTHFTQYGSGLYSIFSRNRVQLPVVIVEATSDRAYSPHSLGSNTLYCDFRVNFHVYTETESEKRKIVDLICENNNKVIKLYNQNLMTGTNWPLTASGTLRSGARSYPQLISDFYFNRDLRMKNLAGRDVFNNGNLSYAVVHGDFETVV